MRRPDSSRALALLAVMAVLVPGALSAQAGDEGVGDAEIAHIAVTASEVDIELAELALGRASDARVTSFAERMIADHTALNEAAAALAGRLGVTPAANDVSRSLRESGAAAVSVLRERAGEAFDRGYMDREVEYHRSVLEALDGVLIPGASNEELRALLEQARGGVAAHLEHAESLRAALGGTS